MINTKMYRSSFIGAILRKKIDEKGITEKEIVKKMGLKEGGQANINRYLNGKLFTTDETFLKIGIAIGLTDIQIKEIFKEADIEEFMYKYGEQLPNERLITYEEALEWIKRKKELTPEQLRAVKEFIEFQKAKGKN